MTAPEKYVLRSPNILVLSQTMITYDKFVVYLLCKHYTIALKRPRLAIEFKILLPNISYDLIPMFSQKYSVRTQTAV